MPYHHPSSAYRRTIRCLITACALGLASPALADTVPHEFQSGEPASAAEVNANFAALAAAISTLQDRVESLETENAELQAELDEINNSELFAREDFIVDLDQFVEVHFISPEDTAIEGPIVRVSGANLQIVNAAGSQYEPDGTGNLVVGFSEARLLSEVCSVGGFNNEADCINAGETWAEAHNTGSHNIVGGVRAAYSRTGGLVVGSQNVINGTLASATGGEANIASAVISSISGGFENTASGNAASISGGWGNIASGFAASVSGGRSNTANEEQASVSGGWFNTAGGSRASVSGGRENTATGTQASISGGLRNTASGSRASISGGRDNNASSYQSSVSGGENCEVSGADGWGARDAAGNPVGDC